MTKRLILFTMVTLYVATLKAFALETVRVTVLPFEIHSIKDLSYMKTEIPRIIKKHLKQEGAAVEDLDLGDDFSWSQISEATDGIRNLGARASLDYVIWGSLTWIGDQFSLDAKMVRSYDKTPPQLFFVEGKGIENLFRAVKDLSDKISLKLFERQRVAAVLITGNKRIEADAIKRVIKTVPGDIFLAKSLSDDLKSVYAMGYFDDIRIEADDSPEGKIITFKIEEKPTIRKILLKGNKHIKDEDVKEALSIRTGSILNINKMNEATKQIEDLYKSKNYHKIMVAYQILQLEHNQADVQFNIEEGEKIRIQHIIFEGNATYPDKKLKKVMQTSEKGFFSWLTSSGELKKDELEQDAARLSAFYHNNGFIQAKVGEPQVDFKDNWIEVTIKIDEGPRFKVGKVDVAGELILPKTELLKKLKLPQEEYYNQEVVRNDVLVMNDLYSDEGYAYADFTPQVQKDIDKLTVNITYSIQMNKQVYFENILIGGNIKTRDKVIRRELPIYEQELFSGRRLKRGIQNLHRLDFFEDIKVDTLKGSTDDQVILKIDVAEKPTGALTFGGGYSSAESGFVMASISQRNLLGRAQELEVRAELGGRTTRYDISFTEPWLFDIPLAAGFDIYKWETNYDEYDKDSFGSGLRFSYPVYDFTRAYLSYAYDNADLNNLTPYAPDSIIELEGNNVTSSVTVKLRYDSRDNIFNPNKGSDHSVSAEYAGLGGDIGFTKYLLELSWYKPLYKSLVGFVQGKAGYVYQNPNGKLPDYERFYLGGINSLRGFDWRDISPTEINKNGYLTKVGGDKFVQFNFEIKFPLLKDSGLYGIVFHDTGNVYNNDESIDLGSMRKTVGFGFRWYSPVGPLRLEYGYILDAKEGESQGGWEFSMGAAFF